MSTPIRVGRVLIAMIIFALGIEAWARIDDWLLYRAALNKPYNNEMLYLRDSVGRVGKPNAQYRKWKLNSLGFRGPELVHGRFTILCFGASETFGLYEAEGHEYPRQLEDSLNARLGGQDVQVVNAAYPGESAYAHLARASSLVDQLSPQVVLIYPTSADYIWLPNLVPPHRRAGSALPPEPFEWRIGERLRTFMKGALPQFVQTRLRARETKSAVGDTHVMDRIPDENLARYRHDIDSLVLLLKARGVEPVVATHASLFAHGVASPADRDQLVAWRKFYPMLSEDGFVDMEQRMNESLRSIARQENVPLIDVAAEIPSNRGNFADFVHFTDQGATLMAHDLTQGLFPIVRQQITTVKQ